MHASAGPHRPFNVRPAKRNGIQVDENMIDRTSGLNKDMEFDTELKDSRWERFNAKVDDDQVDQAQHFERERIKKLSGKSKIEIKNKKTDPPCNYKPSESLSFTNRIKTTKKVNNATIHINCTCVYVL